MAFTNKDLATYTGPLAFGVYTISSVVYDIIPNSLVFGASGDTATEVSLTAGLPVQPQTGATWAVAASSLPLPDGAATFAEQETQTGYLAILASEPPLTDTQLRATAVPVSLTSVPTHAVTDGGSSLTVDGTVAVSSVGGTVAVSGPLTDTELRASAVPVSLASVPTHAVTQSGTWTVTGAGGTFPITDGGGSITVDGTVAVTGTFWQATQPISAVSLPLPSGAATAAKQPALGTAGTASADVISIQGVASMTPVAVSDNGGAITVDDGGSTLSVDDGGGSLTVDGTVAVSGSVAVTGTFWQATQPVSAASLPLPSGASTAAKQPALGTAGAASADVITVQGIASMTALKVDGSAVTQPVSGTFWQATQPVSLASVPSHAVTNAGTFAVQAAQSGTWTVQPGNTANTTAWLVTGTGGTFPATQSGTWSVRSQDGSGNNLTSATRGSERALSVQIIDASGNQVTSFGGGTEYTEDAAAAADPVGKAVILVRKDTPAAVASADGDNVAQRGTNYGAAYVQLVTSAGAFIDSVGGGTQYAEGATAATITGTAILWEDASDTLRPVSASKPLPVGPCSGATLATGQVSVGTSATLVVAARTGRKYVRLVSHASATDLYYGVSGVTTGTGFKFGATGGTPTDAIVTEAAIYAVKGSGSQTVGYEEVY